MNRVLKNKDYIITQNYSEKHKAVDIVAENHETDYIIAHSDGVVTFCQKGQENNTTLKGNASYGNCVKINHGNGYTTLYAHLKEVNVSLNEKVSKGQILGYMGNTGRAFGIHLHFEVRLNNVRINPIPYLTKDLPINIREYQVYDNIKKYWLPNVKIGTNDYAGNLGNNISGLYIDDLKYRVHDKIKKKWLPYVTGRQDYAGNLGNSIDGIQIQGVTYRVYDNVKEKWLPYVTGLNGYAGNLGNEIGGVQIK